MTNHEDEYPPEIAVTVAVEPEPIVWPDIDDELATITENLFGKLHD